MEFLGLNRFKSVTLVFLGSIAASVIFAFLTFSEYAREMAEKRQQLGKMTTAFVATYASVRTDGSIVPASYRKLALDRFSTGQTADPQNGVTMRMSGLPGHEIATVEEDPSVADTITGFANSADPTRRTEIVIRNGRLVGRTIEPSIATERSCAACHNTMSDSRSWAVGDVMGALVVESDLSGGAMRIAQNTTLFFVLSLAALGIFARHENARMNAAVLILEKR